MELGHLRSLARQFGRETLAVVRIIEMLVFPRVQTRDVNGPLQVFASANDILAEVAGEEGNAPPYELRVMAGRRGCRRVIMAHSGSQWR
jgi:hypothetical protein